MSTANDVWRRAVEEIRTREAPTARLVTATPAVGSLAVMPGAYNPPTRAHLALAEAARDRGFGAVLFSLGTVTLDKPETGLPLHERLQLLAQIAEGRERLGVVLQNCGLYAEQAAALRALPGVDQLTFVVGMDKIEQIFDPSYYRDFAGTLERLFAGARLLVAARGDRDRRAFDARLAAEPARRFADRIDWLALDSRWRRLSASAVRERLARGEIPSEWLPEPVERHLRRRGAIF
jgi:nicotinic acid mononucleotide adenylyltransferase